MQRRRFDGVGRRRHLRDVFSDWLTGTSDLHGSCSDPSTCLSLITFNLEKEKKALCSSLATR